jgi:hypothetical protein
MTQHELLQSDNPDMAISSYGLFLIASALRSLAEQS